MYYLYTLSSPSSEKLYIGVTSTQPAKRLACHRNCAKSGVVTVLYSWMRKHGDSVAMTVTAKFDTREHCCNAEFCSIELGKHLQVPLLNMVPGGYIGSKVPLVKRDDWIQKLRAKRVGKTPAAGMKHSEENKRLFSDVSRKYWEGARVYTDEVLLLPFSEAREKYGISKTHYYRLRKRALDNDKC